VGANANHGLKRTNADKRRAVKMLLDDEEWSQNSNVWIADKCGVDETLVRRIKEESGSVKPNVKGKDGKTYTAKKAPREPKAPRSPQSPSGAASNSPQSRSIFNRWRCYPDSQAIELIGIFDKFDC
jgi:hypothetical protein